MIDSLMLWMVKSYLVPYPEKKLVLFKYLTNRPALFRGVEWESVVVLHNVSYFSTISWQEQVLFWRDNDNDVCFVLG
jgi:hypothetical protein